MEDPPIWPGRKHRVSQNIAQLIKPLWHRYVPGGGGFNSAIAMRRTISPQFEQSLDLLYLDVSIADKQVIEELRAADIESHHFYKRDPPVNIVLSGRTDKIVLKGPQLGRVAPTPTELEEVAQKMAGSDSLLINSVKDPAFAEAYVTTAKQHGIPIYAAITTSLEQDFVEQKLLPYVTPIMNYDELPQTNPEPGDDVEAKLNSALETLLRMREIGVNANAYVTLSKHGAYCKDMSGIYHVLLTDEISRQVQEAAAKAKDDSTNGAGDVFAAQIVLSETFPKNGSGAVKAAISASRAAVKHIGYEKHLPNEAFEVRKLYAFK